MELTFSKKIMVSCMVLAILGILGAAIGAAFGLAIEVSCAIIAACGTILISSIVFYLRKAQAENTIKLYVSAYKEIAELKQDPEFLDSIEEKLVDRIDDTLSTELDNATTPIEKEEF